CELTLARMSEVLQERFSFKRDCPIVQGPGMKLFQLFLVCACMYPFNSFCQSSLNMNVPDPSPVPTFHKEVLEISVPFTATDYHGHFLNGLGADDFRVRDNGREPERITHFEVRSELPLRIAVVVDTSASESCCLEVEKSAVKEFLKHMLRPEVDQAVVVGFDSVAHLVQVPTNDYHR